MERTRSKRGRARKHAANAEWESWKARTLRVALQAAGLFRRGRRNAANPTLNELELRFPQLPGAFDGYTILHLSDFHFRRGEPLPAPIIDMLRGVSADLCCLTGDFVWGYGGPMEHVTEAMEHLMGVLSMADGYFAVFGNHDFASLAPPIEKLGIRVLLNENTPIERNGERIWLAGVDDPSYFGSDDIPAALAGAPEEEFCLLLAHSPDCWIEAARSGVDLYLCGHTHGGQLRLPFFGAPHTNTRAPRDCALGLWRVNKMIGYTTAGLGTTEVAVRYNCPPEAVHITLRRGSGPP